MLIIVFRWLTFFEYVISSRHMYKEEEEEVFGLGRNFNNIHFSCSLHICSPMSAMYRRLLAAWALFCLIFN